MADEALRAWADQRQAPVTLLKLEGTDFEGADMTITYKRRGEDRVVIQEESNGGVANAVVWGRNAKYWFRLSRRGTDQPWILTFLAIKSRGDDGSPVDHPYLKLADANWGNYPIVLFDYPVDDLVSSKGFRVQSVVRDERRSALFWVTFSANKDERTRDNSFIGFMTGRMALDSDHGWLAVEGQLSGPYDNIHFVRSDFRNENGRWYAARVDSQNRKEATGRQYQMFQTVTEISTRDQPPLSDFTLTAFGLPEPQEVGFSVLPYVWLAVIGVFFLAIGMYMRRRHMESGVM